MNVAIMQPYFLPYIGYFQLINYVDLFIVYDKIEYSKKGWINRNRILKNGHDDFISLPLKKDSDYLHIDQRQLSDSFAKDRQKIIRRISDLYRKAPEYASVFPLFEQIMLFENTNLFDFVYHSLQQVTGFLGIDHKLKISSDVKVNHHLKSPDRLYDFCHHLNADTYVNPIGGKEMYQHEDFARQELNLRFLKSDLPEYPQFQHQFVKGLSILDVLMFNDVKTIQEMLNHNFQIVS